jgi:hypothetical protein
MVMDRKLITSPALISVAACTAASFPEARRPKSGSSSAENVADVAIVWQTEELRCNTTILYFFAPRLNRAQGKSVILRIAESLRG